MELDFQEYASAWTENISKLMVHSLMRVSRTISRHYPLSFIFFFFFDLTFICSFSVFERGDGD